MTPTWLRLARVTSAAAIAAVLAAGLAAAPAQAATAPPDKPGPVTPGTGKATKDRLDQKGRSTPDSVAGWFVDPASNKVVVSVVGAVTPEATAFLGDVDPATVVVEPNAAKPVPYAELVGGQAIFGGGGRCSIGFSARRGSTVYVITAGHCTELGGTWSGVDQVAIGPVYRTNFPGDDFGAITRTTTTWTPTSKVQGTSSVLGSTEAANGAQVCRSGSTTGYRCGTIQVKNQTVNYGGGDIVYGLTRTSACAEGGDSGGSFVSGRQAQGVLSGGSGNCASGGTTFFQPINEVLSTYGMTLVTG